MMPPPRQPGHPGQLRRMNRRAVVDRIRRGGPASRAEIARDTGLSVPTVGDVVQQLVIEKLLETIDPVTWAALQETNTSVCMGRPSHVLRLNRVQPIVVAIDMGPRMTRLAALPAAGGDDASWRVIFRTPKRAATFLTALRSAKRRLRLARPWCVVAAVPGMVDERTGSVLHAQGLSWMTGTTLPDMFSKLWPAPAVLTTHARVRASALIADRSMSDSFLLVDFGDDMRGAAVVNGHVVDSSVATFGELGHQSVKGCDRACWCGSIGCVNTLASRVGMLKSFRKVKRGQATWRSLVAHVKRDGLPSWLEPTLLATGESIAAAANILGVNQVVITGAMAELGSGAVQSIEDIVRKRAVWSRFGQINVAACAPDIAAGLVAHGIDRVMLPDYP